jgi:aldose 1-epimerase
MSGGREVVALRWADFGLELAPAAGGSIAGFEWRGTPLFRRCPPAAKRGREPLDLAGFPMLPFASRIRDGRFPWQGRSIELPPMVAGDAGPIHGQAWRQPWSFRRTGERTGVLETICEAGDWPWRHGCEQRITLHDDGFALTLVLTNLADGAMPAGLGWHPYFDRAGARLTAATRARLTGSVEHGVPLAQDDAGFEGAAVAALRLDHCFTGWPGTVLVDWPERGCALVLAATAPLRYLTVWVPPGSDSFCVEPVTHVPDAANLAAPADWGWASIEPGESLAAEVRIRVRASTGR